MDGSASANENVLTAFMHVRAGSGASGPNDVNLWTTRRLWKSACGSLGGCFFLGVVDGPERLLSGLVRGLEDIFRHAIPTFLVEIGKAGAYPKIQSVSWLNTKSRIPTKAIMTVTNRMTVKNI